MSQSEANLQTPPRCHQTTELTRNGSYNSLTRADSCSDNPTPSETGSVINSPKSEVLFDYTEEQKKEESNERKKTKSWKQTYCASGMRRTLINITVLSCLLAGVAYLSFTEFYHKYQEAAKEDLERTKGTNSTHVNATNMTQTLQQREVPKIILPLWTNEVGEVRRDLPFVIPTVPPFPGAKAECSMSKKNQCYTGHKCYKRYCVSWCRDNSDCFEAILVCELVWGLVGGFAVLRQMFKFPVLKIISIVKRIMSAVLGHVNFGESIKCVFRRRSLNIRLEHPVEGNDIEEEVSIEEDLVN